MSRVGERLAHIEEEGRQAVQRNSKLKLIDLQLIPAAVRHHRRCILRYIYLCDVASSKLKSINYSEQNADWKRPASTSIDSMPRSYHPCLYLPAHLSAYLPSCTIISVFSSVPISLPMDV